MKLDAPLLCVLANKGNGAPLYLFPSSGSTPMSLIPLARSLPRDLEVISFTYSGMDGNSEPHKTIEEMAAACVQEMRDYQPGGPYRLVGYCFGGTIAYEIAAQLEAAKLEIGRLILVDTFAPRLAGQNISTYRQDIQSELAGIYQNTANIYITLPEASIGPLREVFLIQMEAGFRYLARPVETDIHIIRTHSYPESLFANWNQFTEGTVTMSSISSDTKSILEPSAVQSLARTVVSAMN